MAYVVEHVATQTERLSPVESVPLRATRAWAGAPGRWLGWGALLLIVALGVKAPGQRTGDAHQYHAMAAALAGGRPPALTTAETAAYKGWLLAQPATSGFPAGVRAVDQPALVRDGRQEFSHFWVFPLLVAPFVVATDALGLHRADAFLLANALLLGAALWAIARWSRPVVGLLLLASPLVWFVDKAQVEVFTVAFLALAMVAAGRGRWLTAAFFAAVASTQNLPIAAAVPLFWGVGVMAGWRGRSRSPASRWATSGLVAATMIVALLHPTYYLWRLGVVTPQELNGGIATSAPSLTRYLAPLLDPNIGLLAWAPLLGGLVVAGAVALPRAGSVGPGLTGKWGDLRLAAGCALLLGGWFLVAFSQTSNLNSGGTFHVSRYGLWLLPLAIPFLEALARRLEGSRPLLLPVLGIVSFVVAAVIFRPWQPERYVAVSPQSDVVETWLGGLYRPVPELFYERRQGVDGGVAGSAANPSCTLLLLSEGAADPSCPPTAAERTAATHLFAQGWRAVWIGRPGRLGIGGPNVTGAVRR